MCALVNMCTLGGDRDAPAYKVAIDMAFRRSVPASVEPVSTASLISDDRNTRRPSPKSPFSDAFGDTASSVAWSVPGPPRRGIGGPSRGALARADASRRVTPSVDASPALASASTPSRDNRPTASSTASHGGDARDAMRVRRRARSR